MIGFCISAKSTAAGVANGWHREWSVSIDVTVHDLNRVENQ